MARGRGLGLGDLGYGSQGSAPQAKNLLCVWPTLHSLHAQTSPLAPDIGRMGQPLGAGSNWHGGGAAGGGARGATPSPQDIAWAAQFPSMSVASRRALQEGGLNMATAKLLVDERLYKQPDDLRVS